VEIAQSGGVVIWLGNILGPLTLSPSAVSGVLRKELQIKGSWNSTYRLGQDDDWSAAIRMIETTAWLREAVSHRIRLEETAEVLRDAYARKSHHRPHGYVKIVVDMQME
jgi:L-iditol 2-dehydrogenase